MIHDDDPIFPPPPPPDGDDFPGPQGNDILPEDSLREKLRRLTFFLAFFLS